MNSPSFNFKLCIHVVSDMGNLSVSAKTNSNNLDSLLYTTIGRVHYQLVDRGM